MKKRGNAYHGYLFAAALCCGFISMYVTLFLFKNQEIIPPVHATAFSRQIGASADDVTEDGATYSQTETALWLGTGASTTSSWQGFRFTNITIPQGSTINSAHLDVKSDRSNWIGYSFTFRADDVDNSAAFSSSAKPSGRSLTTATVTHNDDVQWNADTVYSLDDITTVIQEIMDRPGWTSGNSISIILKGTGSAFSRKFIYGYDSSAANSASLVIDYTSATPTNTPTPTLTPTPTEPTSFRFENVLLEKIQIN